MNMKTFAIVVFAIPNLLFAAIPTNLVFKDELKTALNTKASMSQRWKAVINSFQIAKDGEIKQLSQLFEHKDWFIRNASLLAVEKKDRIMAEVRAKSAIKDRALVVRSAATEILIKLNGAESLKTILEEINQPYNFRGKQSLWVRSQMMSYLVSKVDEIGKDFFIQQLFDKDAHIAEMSIAAVEKKLDYKINEANNRKKLVAWKAYVKENKLL
jgi:hypothetical protein